ncbi:beta subunit of the SRP receptor, partial [Thraustotheca clavata]
MNVAGEDNAWLVYLAAFIALLSLVLVGFKLLGSGGRGSRDVILLVGPCGAGKTALFHRLRDGPTKLTTVTSMKETMEKITLFDDENVNIHLCDFPGHDRMRSQVGQFFPIAKKIVFVVDATSDALLIRKAAEFLYDIFTHPKINDAGV